jgi:hypothetical protein
LEWNHEEAHSALYDAERTAHLFCAIVNRWEEMKTLVSGGAKPDLKVLSEEPEKDSGTTE